MDYSPAGSYVMEFSRQEYWSGLPFPSPEDLPNLEIEPKSPGLLGGFFTSEPPRSCIGNNCLKDSIQTIGECSGSELLLL